MVIGRRQRVLAGAGLSVGAVFGLAAADAPAAVVSNNNDTGPGSLRDAVIATNASAADDTVTFASTVTGTISLVGQIRIADELNLIGPGANALTISANNADRIFLVDPLGSEEVDIRGLTLTDGRVAGDDGGAIQVWTGQLEVAGSVISSSEALNGQDGGAISNISPENLVIRDSTITGNSASRHGGGIYDASPDSSTNIYSSTIAGNTAGSEGGGLSANDDVTTVANSTISGNSASSGGGVRQPASFVFMVGSIVADNTAATAPDLLGTVGASGSLIENIAGAAVTPVTNGSPTITGLDPQLGPLQNNGGTTPTRKPATTSIVIDKGTSNAPTDQRGQPRVFDLPSIANTSPIPPNQSGGVDIGAVELQASDFAGPAAPAKCKKKRKKGKGRAAFRAAKKKCKKKRKKKKK